MKLNRWERWSAWLIIFTIVALMAGATGLFIAKEWSKDDRCVIPYYRTIAIPVGYFRVADLSNKEKAALLNNKESFVASSDVLHHLDSLYRNVIIKQEDILVRQADLVNDIRQETNNNLDKHSAWLAFWIAVLAFVGVVCPIAYQALNTRKFEADLDKLSLKIEAEEQKLKRITDAYTIKLNVLSFESVCANNHLEGDGKNIRELYIQSVKRHFQEFICHIDKSDENWNDEQMHIINLLINLEAFLRALLRSARYDDSLHILAVIDDISKLVPAVVEAGSVQDNIIDSLQRINTHLSII